MPTAFDDLTLLGVDDIYSVVDRPAASYMLGASSDTDCDAKVQDLINRAQSNIIKPRLEAQFKNDYADTADGLIVFHDFLVDSIKARMRKQFSETGVNAITPPVGQITTADPLFEQSYPSQVLPSLWYCDDVPTNGTTGTHAGDAENGAFLIDSVHWVTYINQGTKASPTWQTWDPRDLVDYILNPTEPSLKEAVRYQAILLILESATWKDTGAFTENLKRYVDQEERYEKKYKAAMNNCLQLLKIDASGDGVIQDFESTRSAEDMPFA